MKVRLLIASIFLICNGQMVHADALSRTRNDVVQTVGGSSNTADFLRKITPEMMYGYTDFHFDSTTGANFNRYKGHSNLYSGGADHISLSQSIMAGLYYFRIDTALASQFLFTPGTVTTSEQTITNDTIFGHVLKIFTPQIYVDLAGGYGYNRFVTFTEIAASPGGLQPTEAHERHNNDNWFISLNGIYRKSWQKFLLRANLGVLYSEIDTGSYNYIFPATTTFANVAPLVNRSTLILENAEFGYSINSKLMPFIDVGLIQVAQFSNSRPLMSAATVINGSLPQLNMDKSGYRLGGGVSYNYKNLSMRLEEKYYNAGGTFESLQTLASLEYQFS